MIHEIQLGQVAMKWPEKAYLELPGDIRDKIVAAEKAEELHDAVKPWADPTLLETLWNYLRVEHPKHEWNRKWLATGIDWMKTAANEGGEEPVTEDAPQ